MMGSTNWFLPTTTAAATLLKEPSEFFKERFVAGLSSVDPAFPFNLWGRLLRQAEITLNLLHTWRLQPQLSTTAHFHGFVNYNKTYFSPP
jgi:hypothetical protein